MVKLVRTKQRKSTTTLGSTRNAAFSAGKSRHYEHGVQVDGHSDLDDDDDVALMLID